MAARLSFLPGPVAAAAASVVLAVAFALYIVPHGTMVCTLGAVHLNLPDVRSGTAFVNKPATFPISIKADGSLYAGVHLLRDVAQLAAVLRDVRTTRPDLPLEIAADGRAPTGRILDVMRVARDAGFDEVYVFGHVHSVLESGR